MTSTTSVNVSESRLTHLDTGLDALLTITGKDLERGDGVVGDVGTSGELEGGLDVESTLTVELNGLVTSVVLDVVMTVERLARDDREVGRTVVEDQVAKLRSRAVVLERELTRQTLNRSEGVSGNHLRVLPVVSPSDGVSLLARSVGPAAESVKVFAEIHGPDGIVTRSELGSVPVTDKVLHERATDGSTRVDRDGEHIHHLAVIRTTLNGNLEEIRALVLVAKDTMALEAADFGPVLHVGRGVEDDAELLRQSQSDDPARRLVIPEDLGITELRLVARDDGVGVLGEVDAIRGVGKVLRLRGGRVERVHGHNALVLGYRLVKEAGSVFIVDDGITTEDTLVLVVGCDGNGKILPVVQVIRDGVTPVLVAGNILGRVVLIEEMPRSVAVDETVRVVHEVDGGRKVDLRSNRLGVRRRLEVSHRAAVGASALTIAVVAAAAVAILVSIHPRVDDVGLRAKSKGLTGDGAAKHARRRAQPARYRQNLPS